MSDAATGDRAVVLVSGGMDSATAVAEAVERGYEPSFLHTSYGQKTEGREYECAQLLADDFDAAEFLHVETEHLARIGASSLTDDAIDVEDAAPESEDIPTRSSSASRKPLSNERLCATKTPLPRKSM